MLSTKDKKDLWECAFMIALLSVWYLLLWYEEKRKDKEKSHAS